MKVNDFAIVVKRECRYGTPAVTNDQATADILAEINIRRKRIWSFWNWQWALQPLSFPVTPGTTQYTVAAVGAVAVDRITDIIPRDLTVSPPVSGAPLVQLDRQDFYTWSAAKGTDIPDLPQKYVNLGRNSDGHWLIELSPAPPTAFTMAGFAKKVLTTFTLPDLVANVDFDYFPDGVIEDLLLDGVRSGIFSIQGNDAMASSLDSKFETKLKMLKSEQNSAGRDDSAVTTPPPDSMRFKYRNRSKGGTGIF